MNIATKMIFILVGLTACGLISNACSRAPEGKAGAGINPKSARLAVLKDSDKADEFYFSHDGRRVAAVIKKDGKAHLLVDGKQSKPFADIDRVIFAPNGKDIAFRGLDSGYESVVLNMDNETKYQSVGEIRFTPDSRVVYEAQQKEKWMIVSGNKASGQFDMPYAPPVISSDGKYIVYIEQDFASNTSHVTLADIDLTKYEKGTQYSAFAQIEASTDGAGFAYVVIGKDKKWAVVTSRIDEGFALKEQEGHWYDEIYTMVLMPDGHSTAYLARRGKKILLVKDGIEMPYVAHDMRSHLVISGNGAHVANIAVINNRFYIVVDGKIKGSGYDEISHPVALSDNGPQVAYAARKQDKWLVVVDSVEGPLFDMIIAPHFSPDGSRLIYRARKGGKRFVVVADASGKIVAEHPKYDLVWEPTVTPDGKFITYGAKSGLELWWKVEPLL